MSRKTYGCRGVRGGGASSPGKFLKLGHVLMSFSHLGTPFKVLFVDNVDPFSSVMVIRVRRGRIAFRSGTRTAGRTSYSFRLFVLAVVLFLLLFFVYLFVCKSTLGILKTDRKVTGKA